MCDYCDCRRIPAIARFGEEHDRIEMAASRLEEAIGERDESDLKQLRRELLELLEPHTSREESGIFAEVSKVGLEDHVEELEEDHERLHSISELDLTASPEELEVALRAFITLLHDHITREEYDLFPAAAQLLSAAQWERVNELEPTEPPG